ncbi:hypothetical protein COOONC_21850 [Cooperia oncophora]
MAFMIQKLSKKVLDFVKTNQFETQLSTDMISSLIAQMTYASPNFWLPFAEHVLKNLRELLTAEAKAAEDLETRTQWFVSLAGSLLSTTNENYIHNKEICFEMIGLLLDCKSKVAYISGSIGLWYMLYMLSRIYPENTRYIADRLERPLKEWVPIRRNVVDLPAGTFTNFHLRVVHILAKLIINDYSEVSVGNVRRRRVGLRYGFQVRYEALSVFSSLFSEYAIARETIVDDILPTLTNPDSTREQLKGALSIISQTSWATSSTTSVKTKVWKAIIEMKVKFWHSF